MKSLTFVLCLCLVALFVPAVEAGGYGAAVFAQPVQAYAVQPVVQVQQVYAQPVLAVQSYAVQRQFAVGYSQAVVAPVFGRQRAFIGGGFRGPRFSVRAPGVRVRVR